LKQIKLRRASWYIDGHRIRNSGVKSLYDAQIVLKKVELGDSERDLLFLTEDLREFIRTITLMYGAFIRYYDNFKQDCGIYWISKDHDSKMITRKLGVGKCHLGAWGYGREEKLIDIVRDLCGGRIIIAKKEWILEFQQFLIDEGHMRSPYTGIQ